MPQTLLGSLAIAYMPLWDRARELAGIRLNIVPVSNGHVDALHLLQMLRSFWPHKNASLILCIEDPDLLIMLLEQAPSYSPGLEIERDWLEHEALASRVRAAHVRGLHLVLRGPNDWPAPPELADCFRQQILSLDETETLNALSAARAGASLGAQSSPVQRGLVYEGIASRALVEHCLDRQQVAALMGWPVDEALYPYRYGGIDPSARALRQVINAVASDASLEALENLIGQDPVLTYRLLVHVNSAAMGLRSGIDSLRRGLMMMGYTALKNWCMQQLPNANEDRNLHPVRSGLVLRTSLTEFLLDPGGEADLRGEIYLSGLFSQLDLLMGGSLPEILGRIPISPRIVESLCDGTGPYAPYVRLARAMESTDASGLADICAGYEMNLDDVNRALLRTLGVTSVHSTR